MLNFRLGIVVERLLFNKWMRKLFFCDKKGKKKYLVVFLESYQMKMNILRELSCIDFVSMMMFWLVGYIKMIDTLIFLNFL